MRCSFLYYRVQPKLHSSTNWKRVRLNQHTPPAELSSPEYHNVSDRPARKPGTSKRITKTSQNKPTLTTTKTIIPSQKFVFDTSAKVKFAITSSLNTSVPVRHTQRDKHKVVGKHHTVSKEGLSKSEHLEGLSVSGLNHSTKEQTNYHPYHSPVDDTAVDLQFETGLNGVETLLTNALTDSHKGGSSTQSSCSDMSIVSQDTFHSSLVGVDIPSDVDSRPVHSENQDTENIAYDTSQPQTRVSHSSGTFLLEVDMRFKANQISEESQLFPNRFEKEYINESFLLSSQSLSLRTTAEQSTADLEAQVRSTGDLSEVEGQSNLSLSPVAGGQDLFDHNSEVSEEGTSQVQMDVQTTTPFESQQPGLILSDMDHLKEMSTATSTSVLDRASLRDCNVQSKEKVSETDQSTSTPISSHRSPSLDSWPISGNIGFEPTQPLKSGLDTDDGSSSTFKGSKNKDSMFFSIGGSLSSFGVPFSMQSHSNSLTDACSQELTTSTDSRLSNFSPLPHTASNSLSNVDRAKPTYSKPNVEQYLLSSSDQHLTTSSWLKTVGSDVHFSCDSDPFSETGFDLEANKHQDTHAADLKNSSDVFSSSSSTELNMASYSTQILDEVSKLDPDREILRDQFYDRSIVNPDSASEQPQLEAQHLDSENDNMDKSDTVVAKEVAKENVTHTVAIDGLGTGGHIDFEEGESLHGSFSVSKHLFINIAILFNL